MKTAFPCVPQEMLTFIYVTFRHSIFSDGHACICTHPSPHSFSLQRPSSGRGVHKHQSGFAKRKPRLAGVWSAMNFTSPSEIHLT